MAWCNRCQDTGEMCTCGPRDDIARRLTRLAALEEVVTAARPVVARIADGQKWQTVFTVNLRALEAALRRLDEVSR